MSDPRVTVELLARADLSLKSALVESRARQWQEVLSDVGSGSLILQNDDPDLALVEYGDFIRFSLDGVARFVIQVEAKDRIDVAPGEDADEFTTIKGRGALAMLEDATVYPDIFESTLPFADARPFNFSSFWAMPQSGIPAGSVYTTPPYDWGDRLAGAPAFYEGKPTDFPFVYSHWIGPQAPDGSGNNPGGDWYFYAFILSIPDGVYRLYIGYDDGIDLWIDNVPILANQDTQIEVCKTVDLYLQDALHVITAKVTNHDPAGPPHGPTGITMALCTLNPDGSADTEAWATGPAYTNQWVAAFPAVPPGFTPGELMEILWAEATGGSRNVGVLNLITFGFDSDNDSNGDAWTDQITPSFQIGLDYLAALRQVAESSFVFRLDPDTFTLNLYQTYGAATAVAYTEAVNITDLKHSGAY